MVSSRKLKVGGLLGQTHLSSSVFMAVVNVAHGKGLICENEPTQRSISTCNLSNSHHHKNIGYDILTFFTAFMPWENQCIHLNMVQKDWSMVRIFG